MKYTFSELLCLEISSEAGCHYFTERNTWFREIPIFYETPLEQAKIALYLKSGVLVLARDGFQIIKRH